MLRPQPRSRGVLIAGLLSTGPPVTGPLITGMLITGMLSTGPLTVPGALAAQAVNGADTAAEAAVRRVTHTGARNGQVPIAPEGAFIAFVSNRTGSWQVWVSEADGSNPSRVTTESEPVGWPTWDALGDTLFYYVGDGEYRLMWTSLGEGTSGRIDVGPLSAFRPQIHPLDPSRLLMDAVDPRGRGDHDVYAWDRVSRVSRRLTTDPGYDSDARWSPDGRRIVFHSDRGAESFRTQVYTASATGADARRMTDEPGAARYPAWSPNGRCVVYVADVDAAYRTAINFGATSVQEPTRKGDDPDKRGGVRDAGGNTWWLASQMPSR